LLGRAKPARAETLRVPVPEVDRLAARVVTDSYQVAIDQLETDNESEIALM